MKVTLTKVQRSTTNKDGEPYISKNTGKPFTICRIWTVEHGEKSLGGFDSYATDKLKEGDEVEIIIEESGQYLNFKMPSDKVTRKEFDALDARVKALEAKPLTRNRGSNLDEYEAKQKMENPPEEDGDDLPF